LDHTKVIPGYWLERATRTHSCSWAGLQLKPVVASPSPDLQLGFRLLTLTMCILLLKQRLCNGFFKHGE